MPVAMFLLEVALSQLVYCICRCDWHLDQRTLELCVCCCSVGYVDRSYWEAALGSVFMKWLADFCGSLKGNKRAAVLFHYISYL
jgi:hypothetical protein